MRTLIGDKCSLNLYSGNQVEFGLTLMAQDLNPKAIFGFSVWLGRGCEPLFLGLAETDDGFKWQGVCETYGERSPNFEVFEHRHDLAVRVLDLAKECNINIDVIDCSGYYKHRDLNLLRSAAKDSESVITMLDQHRNDPLVNIMRSMHGGQYDERPI